MIMLPPIDGEQTRIQAKTPFRTEKAAGMATIWVNLQQLEDFFGMVGAVGFVNNVGDVAALIDDEGDAIGHAQQTHRTAD